MYHLQNIRKMNKRFRLWKKQSPLYKVSQTKQQVQKINCAHNSY